MRWSWRRAQRWGAVALVLLPLGFLFLRCTASPDISFVRQSSQAPWITAARPVSALLQQWGRTEIPVDRFERGFRGGAAAGPVVVSLRALRGFRLFVNGELVGESEPGADWRRESRIDITSQIRAGENALRVDVENATGPPLLSLRTEGLDPPVLTDATWEVVSDGIRLGPAQLADDTRVGPERFGVPKPARVFAERRDTVLLLFTLGVLGFFAWQRLAKTAAARWLPGLGLGMLGLIWLALFGFGFTGIPLNVGFDATHHLAYLEFLREQGALPLAGDGWSTYQPPLFYLLSAGVLWLAPASESAQAVALKLLPFGCGLGSVVVALLLARRLFPRDPRVAGFAVLFAAVLPMNLYGSAYFSNEMPHAFAVGLALLATAAALLAKRTSPSQAVAVGVWFGIAALSKFTALALLPVALLFLACKPLAVERGAISRAAGLVALCALSAIAVAGWYYARNWIELGHPLVGNWALSDPGQIWWQQPGFHTWAYYTGFGESLRHPYQSGFHSFWDGIYSTFWGDGGIAGRAFPRHRHGHWNYDFMSLGYLVALPATLLLMFGAGRALWMALSVGDARLRLCLSFLLTAAWAMGFSILAMTVQLPFFAQAKAFYGLCMGAPLALFFALGATRVDDALADRRWLALRAGFYAWLFLFASVLILSFYA
jgi:hypothetical protein